MKTVWHILPILFSVFTIGSVVSKAKSIRLVHNLVLAMATCYLIYAININWGRYFVLLSHLLFVFLIFDGKRTNSLFVSLIGLAFSVFQFHLGYAIVVTVSLYWVLLYSRTKKWRLELRYFLLSIVLEVVFLSFDSVGFFWTISFIASRVYGNSLLNLILVSDHLATEE